MKINTFISQLLSNITAEIAFNTEWHNGTGYLDYAVSGEFAPAITPGELVKSKTDDDRNIIFIGTNFGNIVVFQRYSNNDENYVYNSDSRIERLISPMLDTLLKEDQLLGLFGIPALADQDNFGARLARLLNS